MVTGENGSGKTALLLTLAKIIEPLTILNGGFDFPVALYLPQDSFSFFWRETVREELLQSFHKSDIPGWLDDLLTTSPFLLSEGQRKKLALEICYSKDCNLLLDEPSQALDMGSIEWLLEKTIEHAENHLVIIATNDNDLVKSFNNCPVVIEFSK